MPREIADGIHWIQGCIDRPGLAEEYSADPPDWYEPARDVHTCQNAYLIGGEQTLLLDTLSPANTSHVLDEVEAVLDGRQLDYLVVSHPETPHAGNTRAIREEYPGLTLVSPDIGDEHELYFLDDSLRVEPGDEIDLGRKAVEFVPALFVDHGIHLWMRETTTGTFFPVDWLGFPHMDSACLSFVDKLDHEVTVDQLLAFHGRVFFWYQYVDLAKTTEAVKMLAEQYGSDLVAPAHGLPIRDAPAELMSKMTTVIEHVHDSGRFEVFG